MSCSPTPAMLILFMAALWSDLSYGQRTLGPVEKERDVRRLDSLVLEEWRADLWSMECLEARDALIRLMRDSSATPPLDWALALHRWLRSAQDAHLRMRFIDHAEGRCEGLAPSRSTMLDSEGYWEGFAPGRDVSESARAAWLEATWAWIGTFGQCAGERPLFNDGLSVELQAGMGTEDCGDHVRWVIHSFGEGAPKSFRKAFSKAVRFIRRAGKPVLLDLRGNLGGFRTRRHAVLSVFLDPADWPIEYERTWGRQDTTWTEVPPMPLTSCGRPLDVPLAVLLDGLSFSASLLLTDALVSTDRAAVFGCAPLGVPGGCSGSPVSHVLPGSGWIVEVPTRMTQVSLNAPLDSYGLTGDAGCDAGARAMEDAVSWLLTSPPAP